MCCIINGQEFGSDVGRVINKFDIYLCDLGEIEESVSGGNIGKTRPCVIVSSDDYNNPKNNMHMIAPIRTEHKSSVTKETLDTIVEEKRNLGRIYVPIEMAPGDFRFIDITETRKISSTLIIKYISSVINPKVKKKINIAMMNYLFSFNEVEEIFNNLTKDESHIIDKPPVQNKNIIQVFQHSKLPNGVNLICAQVINGSITSQNAATKLGLDLESFNYAFENYKKSLRQNTLLINTKSNNDIKNVWSRKKIEIPDNFEEIYDKIKRKDITNKKAIEILGLSNSTFYRMKKEYESNIKMATY